MIDKAHLQELSRRTGQPVDVLEKIIKHYYAHIRKQLGEMVYYQVHVPGLGMFKVRPKRLQKRITQLQRDVAHLQNKQLSPVAPVTLSTIIKQKQTEITKLTLIHEQLLEESQRRALITYKRSIDTDEDTL